MGWRRSSLIEDVYHHRCNDQNSKKTSGGVGGDGEGEGHGHDSVAAAAAAVGLRILIHQYSKCDSNSNSTSDNCTILLKSKLIKLSTNSSNFHLHPNPIPSKSILIKPPLYSYNCFLKSCFLCHKTLSPHKDVYMYRGDQGFCSEECRNRQIYVDEIREIEIFAKKMLALHGGGGRCVATTLLQERSHRHRRRPLSRRHQPIFSYS